MYVQIADELRKRAAAAHKTGGRMPTENELMAQYHVSRHTVRQALDQLVHENLLVRTPGKGTFVAEPPPTASQVVAVILTYISDYIFPAIIRGIERRLQEESFSMLLFSTQNQFDMERRAFESALSHHCRGIIIEPAKSTLPSANMDMFEKMYGQNLPVVMLHAASPGLPPFRKVLVDDQEGTYLVTQHLVTQGHARVGGIFKVDDKQGLLRFKGFVHALQQAGLRFNPDWVHLYTTESKAVVTEQYTRAVFGNRDAQPTAVVCYNDEIAVNLLKQAAAQGLAVPEELSIVGFDDSLLALASQPELTTVRHPQEEMGRIAADELLAMIHGRTVPADQRTLRLTPQLVVRTSAQPPSGANAEYSYGGLHSGPME
nr:GntR family transcriptional regulator [Sulfobacillus harzensis]